MANEFEQNWKLQHMRPFCIDNFMSMDKTFYHVIMWNFEMEFFIE